MMLRQLTATAAMAVGLLLCGVQAAAEQPAGPTAQQQDQSAAATAEEGTTEPTAAQGAEADEPAGDVPAMPDEVEEILNTPVEADDYGDSPQCLYLTRIRDSEVLDGRHVVFRVGRDTYYLVQFKRRCPLLNRNDTIMYTTHSSRLCVLDPIRSVEGAAYGSPPGPPCPIPSFRQISKEQLTALREALQKPRKGDLIDEQEAPPAEGSEPAEPASDSDANEPG